MNARVNPAADADESLRELMRDIELGNAGHVAARRQAGPPRFLKLTGMAGGGLVLAFWVGGAAQAAAGNAGEFAPNAFLRISRKARSSSTARARKSARASRPRFR